MTNITQFAAIVDGVSKKKDNTLSIKLGTQELSAEDTASLFQYGNSQIWVAFKEAPLHESEVEMPDFIPEFEGQKSFAERQKNVLYRIWEQKTDKSKTSRQFYEDYMEKSIASLKENLN